MIHLQNRPVYEEVASFIAELNKEKHHHVGYCGEQTDEVLHTLLNEFSDLPLESSLVAAFEDDRMVGVFGIDLEKESGEGELWGPFVRHVDWHEVATLMWAFLNGQVSDHLKKVVGFYNVENQNAHQFMEWLAAEKRNRHAILKIAQGNHTSDTVGQECVELSDPLIEDFQRLHDETFEDTYFSSVDILGRKNRENKVFVEKDGGDLKGYIYVEANPAFGEGDIHYVAVSPQYRKQGVGKRLVQKGLDFMFSFQELEEIVLCVDADNEQACRLYVGAGFKKVHTLNSYVLEVN
ncbi:GNAT family N-acetyltransferase [Pseudalkalibacillus sp. Hm43]|uniref:GNAT family N-acetyltransferase n=1 Tax=Pseudalkalibacillus sp. Hm43 TaxID=3450742 RepID=UPI003F4240C2